MRPAARSEPPLTRGRALLAVTVVTWSIVGFYGADYPWRDVRLGSSTFEERGLERIEGVIYRGALFCAALAAGYVLFDGRPLPAALVLVAAAVALGAVLRYIQRVFSARATLRDVLREAGMASASEGLLSGSLRPAAIVALVAALATFSAALALVWRSRRSAVK
jgi:hypothetical protein